MCGPEPGHAALLTAEVVMSATGRKELLCEKGFEPVESLHDASPAHEFLVSDRAEEIGVPVRVFGLSVLYSSSLAAAQNSSMSLSGDEAWTTFCSSHSGCWAAVGFEGTGGGGGWRRLHRGRS